MSSEILLKKNFISQSDFQRRTQVEKISLERLNFFLRFLMDSLFLKPDWFKDRELEKDGLQRFLNQDSFRKKKEELMGPKYEENSWKLNWENIHMKKPQDFILFIFLYPRFVGESKNINSNQILEEIFQLRIALTILL